MQSTCFVLFTCVTFIVAVQALPFVIDGGGRGALGLEVFKNIGKADVPGFQFIDAGAFVGDRRSKVGNKGPSGAPGAPKAAPEPIDVDLCYLIDITGSMSPHIKAVRNSIQDTLSFLTNSTGLVGSLRLCFVGYRDFKDDHHIQTLPFTTDVEKFLEFVDGLDATGGHDLPEDIFSGLEEIGKQDWQAERRIVLHMADAPCHGDGCGGGTTDPKGRNAEDVFRPIRAEKIIYSFGRITNKTRTMVMHFSEAYGQKISLFDVSPEPKKPTLRGVTPEPKRPTPRGPTAESGLHSEEIDILPGPPDPVSPTDRGLNRKVGEATIAAVLLGISR